MAMTYGAEAMRRPVEIEFAVNLNNDRTGEFYLLQVRPIVDSKQMLDEDITAIPDDQCLLRSHNSLGHGVSDDVVDVVYVKTDSSFTASNNPAISAARVIVEEGLEHYRVDPSQGTHFFQNLTSFGVGYFTINPYKEDGFYQRSVLDALPAVEEMKWVRHVRFPKPLKIMMDGKKQEALIMLPQEEKE